MFQANMVGHLWDIVDEGLEGVLDLLQGRIGVTGLCTPVTSAPVRHLRYGRDVSPRVFHTRGGVFFQPDKAAYENTRCKPTPAEWLKTRNPLAKLSELCRERKLGLRAVIECTNIGRIASGDPHFARKNVFDDASPSQMCLANPDVAEFIRALAVDAGRNYAIDAVELIGLDAMETPADDPHSGLGPGGRHLMAICFCESCKRSAMAAGVDVEAAARSTAVRLDTVFRTGQPIESARGGLTTLVADDPPLASFLGWYRDRIAELCGRLRNSSGVQVISHTRPMRTEDDVGIDFGYTRDSDAVVCDYAGWETAPLECLIQRTRGALDDGRRLEVQLAVHTPAGGQAQTLVRNLTRAAELGITSANLDHYGRLPRDHVDLVKQAIRFARRTSG